MLIYKKRRKCVLMIQPINALNSRICHRGLRDSSKLNTNAPKDSKVALINAGGISMTGGAIATLVARSYTNSFGQAGVIGLFTALLTMLFMSPHLIEKMGVNHLSKKQINDVTPKQESQKIITMAKEYSSPAKKLIQFRSDKVTS